jgi:hypothetical protein
MGEGPRDHTDLIEQARRLQEMIREAHGRTPTAEERHLAAALADALRKLLGEDDATG